MSLEDPVARPGGGPRRRTIRGMPPSSTSPIHGVIAVVRADSPEVATTIALGLERTPVSSIEITMTVPDAVDVIRDLSRRLAVPVGVGTVTDRTAAEAAVAAGATFVVSPGLVPGVVEVALAAQVPVVPGALTPTEIMSVWEGGATAVKVFPVSAVGGPSYIRSVRAPLPHVPLVVSGGIAPDEVGAYLDAGAVGVALGSSLVDEEAARSGDADAVERYAVERFAATG